MKIKLLVCILVLFIVLASIPVASITLKNEKQSIIQDPITLPNKDDRVFDAYYQFIIMGEISDLEIEEEALQNNLTLVCITFFAESVYIKGGIPAHAGGWGVVPPKFINELITGEYVTLELIEEDVYNCYEIKGKVTENHICLLFYGGHIPFIKALNFLFIFFGQLIYRPKELFIKIILSIRDILQNPVISIILPYLKYFYHLDNTSNNDQLNIQTSIS